MAIFSVNQVRHLYVANVYKSSVTTNDLVGTLSAKADTAKNHLYFEYKSPGGPVRSDLISIKSISHAKATDADTLAKPLKRHKLILDTTVNGGLPVAGQDYLLKLDIMNYIGLGDELTYTKFGTVRAYTGMTASVFYRTLALSLVKNFAREVNSFFKFYLETGGTQAGTVGTLVEVTELTKESALAATYTGLVIEEKEQEWSLGVYPQTSVNYTVTPDKITVSGDSLRWGIVTQVASANKVENGKVVADMEYFYIGERGDQYRVFPNSIKTTYVANPAVKYNMIDISYSHQDGGEGVQKSEKTITLAIPKVGATNSVSNVLANSIISAINTAAGTSIPLLGLQTS